MATDQNINLLNTNNPDKDIEYFWITFKMCCKKIVNRTILNMIDKLSTDLNAYQQKKDFKSIYENIHLFITENINYIVCDTIINGDIEDAKNVHLCIVRWKRVSPSFDLSTLEYDLLRIIKNLNEENDNIRTHIKYYIQDPSDIKLITLFELAIRERFVCLIDVLKKYVDIHTYIDCKMNETINFLVGRNLIQFLKMQ
jgi:hypothetical protein